MKNIPKIRKQIIHNYFKFYKQNLSVSDFYNSPFSYPATWSKNSGYYILKLTCEVYSDQYLKIIIE